MGASESWEAVEDMREKKKNHRRNQKEKKGQANLGEWEWMDWVLGNSWNGNQVLRS